MTQAAAAAGESILVTVRLFGLLQAAVSNSDEVIEVSLPAGADVLELVRALSALTPLFDPRSIIAVLEGAQVPLDHKLRDGDQVKLYPMFGGG